MSVVLVLGLVSSANAVDIIWTDANDTHIWGDPCNWDLMRLPLPTDGAQVGGDLPTPAAQYPTISSPGAVCDDAIVGKPTSDANVAILTVAAGGELTTTDDLNVGTSGGEEVQSRKLVMTGGVINVGDDAKFGKKGEKCYLEMTGGTITLGTDPDATIDDGILTVPEETDGPAPGLVTSGGEVHLDGGTLICNGFRMRGSKGVVYPGSGGLTFDPNSYVDIDGGTLIINRDARVPGSVGFDDDRMPDDRRYETIFDYIYKGWLTGCGGVTRAVEVVYDENADTTTITADADGANRAWGESPSSGSRGLGLGEVLRWSPGDNVATTGGHHLYISENEDPKTDSIVDVIQDGNTYDTAAIIGFEDLGKTYYWCVDEINGLDTWAGYTWNFAIQGFVTVEDFEAYADTAAMIVNWTAIADTTIALETTIARLEEGEESGQSMRTQTFYSGGATLALGSRDWTPVDTLGLYFYGQVGNAVTDMDLTLNDGDTGTHTIAYDGAMANLADPNWQLWWKLDLAAFETGGVDLSDVASLTISIAGGDADVIYFDDIGLYLSRCVLENAPPGDFTDDCLVNIDDLDVMTDGWLDAEVYYDHNEPPLGEPNLLVYYNFDETSGTVLDDQTTYDNDGVVGPNGADNWDPNGKLGGCLNFNPIESDVFFVQVPNDVFAIYDWPDPPPTRCDDPRLLGEITVSVWAYGDTAAIEANIGTADNCIYSGGYDEDVAKPLLRQYAPDKAGDDIEFKAGQLKLLDDPDSMYVTTTATWSAPPEEEEEALAEWKEAYAGQWNNYIGVIDIGAGIQRLYVNGILKDEYVHGPDNDGAVTPVCKIDQFTIGCRADISRHYWGKVDEFKVYDYALSPEEVMYLNGLSTVFYPLENDELNLVDDGAAPGILDSIEFRDFAKMAENWLLVGYFPEYVK